MYRRQSLLAISFMLRSLQPGGAKLMLGEGRGGWPESWSYLGLHSPKAACRSPAFNSTCSDGPVTEVQKCQPGFIAVIQAWFEMRNRAQRAQSACWILTCLINIYAVGFWSCREKLQRTGDQLPKSSWNNHTEINLYQERTAVLLQDKFSSAIFCHATFPVAIHLVAIQPRASWQPWAVLAHCIGLSHPGLLPGRPT